MKNIESQNKMAALFGYNVDPYKLDQERISKWETGKVDDLDRNDLMWLVRHYQNSQKKLQEVGA